MKKSLLILVCLLGLEASAQQKQPQLSETELKSAQVQIRKAVDNLTGYIVRLGNSEMAGGASPEEKMNILKFIKRSFYEFNYRYVSVRNRSGLKRLRAENYFYNLASQGSRSDGFLRVYKIEADEIYLTKKVLNPRNYTLITAKNGVRMYKITIPVTQIFLKTSSQYSPEKASSNNTTIEKDAKKFNIFVLVDDEGDVLCKLGDINIKSNK